MSRNGLLPTRTTIPSRAIWPFARFGEWPEVGLLANLMHSACTDAIRVEEFVEADNLVVRAELPGIDPDKDVEVSISGGALHIQVTREDKVEQAGHEGFRTEFHYGSFARSIALPTGASESDVKATYDNGVLEVRLPIAKTATHKVEVKAVRHPAMTHGLGGALSSAPSNVGGMSGPAGA